MKDIRELPRPLIPWAPYLKLLPIEQILSFAPLVQRLDIAIGPLRVQARGGAGEPDGFDGISRRGSYDRLLLSEWLLADEIPEEFARRAAMSEHAFLQIARQEPAGARISFALFDAGPNQLGAPRIAHLAALIVLARRAEAVGARFEWGVVQRPDEPPQVGITSTGLAALFAARSPTEATEEHLSLWRERVFAQAGHEEFWIVGGPRLRRLHGVEGAAQLLVTDPFLPGERYLNAEIRQAGRPDSSITLDLPDDATCVRLFRDPANDASTPTGRVPIPNRVPVLSHAPESNLLFLPDGTKLIGRLSRMQLVSYPVPNSPHAGVGKTKSISARSGRPIIAVGKFGKDYAVVTTTDEPQMLQIEWVYNKCSPRTRFILPSPLRPSEVRDKSPIAPLLRHHNAKTGIDGWMTVIDGALLLADATAATPEAALVCMETKAVVEWPGGEIAWIGQRDGKWTFATRTQRGADKIGPQFPSMVRAFFGTAGPSDQKRLAALLVADNFWRTCKIDPIDYYQDDDLTPAGGEVVGVYGLARTSVAMIGFVLLEEDRRTLNYWHEKASGLILRAESKIVRITVSPYVADGMVLTNLAYLTEQGELVIYSLTFKENVLRIQFPDTLRQARAELVSVLNTAAT